MNEIKTNTARILFEMKDERQVWQLERACRNLIGNLLGVVITVSHLSFINEFGRGKGATIEVIANQNIKEQEFERIVSSIVGAIKSIYVKDKMMIIYKDKTYGEM